MKTNSLKSKMKYGIFSDNRNSLMGLATISIILFHYAENAIPNAEKLHLPQLIVFLSKVEMTVFSSCGVEIFLFLSGIGLYFSMTKDNSTLSFYRKRLSRIAVPYLLVGGMFWIVKDMIILGKGIGSFLYDFFFISFWTQGVRATWYIAFIVPLYLVFPLLFHFVEKRKNRVLAILGCILVYICSYILISYIAPEFTKHTEVALSRILVFMIGYALAPAVKNNSPIKIWHIICCVGLFFICKAGTNLPVQKELIHIFSRWSYCFYTLLIVLVLAIIFEFVHINWIDKVIMYFSRYSLEIYLIQVTVRNICNSIGYNCGEIFVFISVLAVTLILSPLVSRISKKVNKALRL